MEKNQNISRIKNGQKNIIIPIQTKNALGEKSLIKMKDGSKIAEEIRVADAHPNGKNPFKREDYIKKFKTLDKRYYRKS